MRFMSSDAQNGIVYMHIIYVVDRCWFVVVCFIFFWFAVPLSLFILPVWTYEICLFFFALFFLRGCAQISRNALKWRQKKNNELLINTCFNVKISILDLVAWHQINQLQQQHLGTNILYCFHILLCVILLLFSGFCRRSFFPQNCH